MNYLPEKTNTILKNNIRRLIDNGDIDLNGLCNEMRITTNEFNARIADDSTRELTPSMFYDLFIYALKNNIKVNLLGDLPDSYGDRLKYFIYEKGMDISEFARRTDIPMSLLLKMSIDKRVICSRHKEKMCRVLTEEEFNKLSPYTNIDLKIKKDKEVIRGINFAYNIYIMNNNKYFSPEMMLKELNIKDTDMNKFFTGKINITPTRKQKIARYIKVPIADVAENNLFKDSLNLGSTLNKFGYWMANKLYTENNSILLFAERCNLDVDYIAGIISGQILINTKDVKNIADHLSVDPEGLINVIPKTDEELLPLKLKTIKKENNNIMVDNFDLNNDFNKRIRTIIERKGYGFKEFCKVMDINSNTFTSALHRGRLPLKNQELVIKALGLDMIPETSKVPKKQSSKKTTAEMKDNSDTKIVSMDELENMCKDSEPEVTDNKIDEKDLIEVLENFSVMDDNLQISFVRLIDIGRNAMSSYEHIGEANVLGRIARMNYINDLAK